MSTISLESIAAAPDRLRADAVSLKEALAQSVSVMAPAMSGAFITYLVAVKSGGATPLAFVLATLSCLLIGTVVSGFARHLPSAGSLYTYTVHGLGSLCGFVVGLSYSIAFAVVGPSVLAGFGVFTALVMDNAGAPAPFTQWWLWFAVGLLLYIGLSWRGIEFSTRAQLLFTAATMAALLLLAAVIIGDGGASGNTLDAFRPAAAGVSWPLVFGGLAFSILSFTGFETAAVLGEEVRNPRRTVPLAVMGSVVLGGAFYVVVTYATSIGFGVAEATTAWPASAAGIVTQADRYASWLTDWALLAGGLSALFCGLGVHNAATRTIYAMGRDGVLPAALGRTHPRHRTPHIAVMVNVVVTLLVAAAVIGFTGQATRDAVGATPGPLSAGFYLFAEGLTLITPLFMACYAVLSVAGIRFALARSPEGSRGLGLAAAAAGSLVASGAALVGSLYYSFVAASPGAGIPGPYRAVPVFCLAVVAGGTALGLVLRARRRQAWAAMGAVFE